MICPASFRETCQWLKFRLNGLRAQGRVSPVVGLLPLASGPACLGMVTKNSPTRQLNKKGTKRTAEFLYAANNKNNIYLLQLGCYWMAVVILHVYRT